MLAKAVALTGIKEKTSLIHLGLEALIARESSKRLAMLGGKFNCFFHINFLYDNVYCK